MTDKKQIRRTMRAHRRQLSAAEQGAASQGLVRQLTSQHWFTGAQRIGLYLAADGEIDPLPVTLLREMRFTRFYVPVLYPVKQPRRLTFAPLTDACYEPYPTRANRMNIQEPCCSAQQHLWPTDLDVLLMPLVAFDDTGNRVGMGGGYYDRTLMVRAAHQAIQRPRLVGLAHHFQQIDGLPADAWDVPVQSIVTDRASHQFTA